MELAIVLWQLELKKIKGSIVNDDLIYLARICKSLSPDPYSELFKLISELLPEENRSAVKLAFEKLTGTENAGASAL